MPGVAGRKAGDFQVIVKQAIRHRLRIIFPAEELFLIVVARTPGEHAAYVQLLALDLPSHVFGTNALRGVLIMRTASGVNMMIAGVPAVFRWVNPSCIWKETFSAAVSLILICFVCARYSGPSEHVTL